MATATSTNKTNQQASVPRGMVMISTAEYRALQKARKLTIAAEEARIRKQVIANARKARAEYERGETGPGFDSVEAARSYYAELRGNKQK